MISIGNNTFWECVGELGNLDKINSDNYFGTQINPKFIYIWLYLPYYTYLPLIIVILNTWPRMKVQFLRQFNKYYIFNGEKNLISTTYLTEKRI